MQQPSNQCPVCLKMLSSPRYLQKHLFMNKKKCIPPAGHTPPKIDYEEKVILWDTSSTDKVQHKVKIKQKTEEKEPVTNIENQESKVTNKYTIAVDSDGNMINLPHIETQNDVVENNPVLMEQIKKIVKNLNVSNGANFKLPPEIEQYQKKIEEILEQFGDVRQIIETGLNNDLSVVETIISMNYDEDNNTVYIERITIPENLRNRTDRTMTFIEIIYSGMYQILTNLIAHKSRFFEVTHSKKAYDDRSVVMKYRKCVLVSYLVLKYRLDKMQMLQKSQSEHYSKIMSMCEKYINLINNQHLPNIHQYDECFLTKLKLTGKLSIIELHSIISFYETFTQLININSDGKFINPACNKREDTMQDDINETEFKREPDYKYINLENLSWEHILFPDYDYEIIDRDFCSYLVKITPKTIPRTTTYDHPVYYYKRIYIDGSSAPPLEEQDYQMLIGSY